MAKKKAAPKKKPGGGARKRVVDTAKRKQTAPKRKKARPSQKKRKAAQRKAAKAKAATASAPSPSEDPGKSPPGPATTPAGGGGGPSALDGTMSRSDMVAIGSALRQRRVEVRDDAVTACINRAARIGLSTTKERNALAAARLLLTAVQINQADEHKGIPDKIQVDARVMTAEGQRAALLAAIAAEKQRRARKAAGKPS